ncbi:LptF/LptG family permease [Rhizobiaceae bacterium]|nr:LptF/LptG family permease [Rhizobiaceae bacterium]
MGLTRIERYLFRKAALSTLIAGGGLIGVLWVLRAVQEVDVIMNKGQGIVTYITMITLGVPTLAAAIAPLALLIGLVRTINALNADSELVVIHASGASRVTLLRPFLALSLLVGMFVLLLQLWVGPSSMAQLRTYVTQVRADLVSIIVREGVFSDVGDGMTFHIAGRAPGGLLKDVFIHDSRKPDEPQTYVAREGRIEKLGDSTFLLLNDGQVQSQSGRSQNLSTVDFDSYAFDLSTYGSARSEAQSQLEVPTLELMYPNAESSLYRHRPARFTAELNARLTGWLHALAVGMIVLAYLGDPLSHRQGQTLVVILCCTVAIGLRAIGVVAEGAARSSFAAIVIMWAMPISAIVVSAILIAFDLKAVPDGFVRWAEAFGGKVMDRLSSGRRGQVEA